MNKQTPYFLARQPIFDEELKLYGYELLFRSEMTEVFEEINGDTATSAVISDSHFIKEINAVRCSNRAFVNFTKNTLAAGYAQLFPSRTLGVELQASVKPEPEVLQMLKELKEEGYLIAVDNYAGEEERHPLIEYADIVKIDFLTTTPEQQKQFADRFKDKGIQMLAGNLERHKQVMSAREMGYTLYQGFFFCKPLRVKGERIPETKITKLQLLQAVNQTPIDFDQVEEIMRNDVAMSYKLLTYINSAKFGLRDKLNSIRQALVLLGQQNLRKWGSLMAFSFLADDKPTELLVTTVVRARFCELMADLLNRPEQRDSLFMIGMFSTLDALLDKPMKVALGQVPLADEIKGSLLGERGFGKTILDAVIGYEIGDWRRLTDLHEQHVFEEELVPYQYLQAVEMADSIFQLEKAHH
ncbi:MAG: EAL and HDOD domain-containing protein [Planctomycetota bacterium]|jgi:EAL and modified HD-GYP domain-containing signal transduction protein